MNTQHRPKPHSLTIGKTGKWPLYLLPVVLRGRELEKHKHIMGISGAGKSKLNAHIATSLLLQGQPCSVVDPHADLTHDVLAILFDRGYFKNPDAYDKLWYVEFARTDRVLPFNVLHQPYSVQTTVRNLLEAVKRVFPALDGGAAPNFENILQYTAVALTQNRLPVTDASRVLTEKDFREQLLAHCTHEETQAFFHTRFDQWDSRERTHNIESTLNKISIFTFTDSLKYALGARENRLNFRSIMDNGVSVLFNLGNLDAETRHLVGSLIMVGFEQATLSRADSLEAARRHYHLLVDEFAQFSTRSEEAFTTFLSEARKFKVTLWLSHQTGMQLSPRFQSALQNALPIFFQPGRSDALWAAQIFGTYDPFRVKHTVADQTQEQKSHPVFWGVNEQFEDMARQLEELRPREAYMKLARRFGPGMKTIKFRTVNVPKSKATWEEIQTLRDDYANRLLVPFPTPAQGMTTPAVIPRKGRVRAATVSVLP
jgi:hypothetical protein